MRPAQLAVLSVCVAAFTPGAVGAQVAGSHLLLAASGNLPFVTPSSRLSLYDQVTLSALSGATRVGARGEFHRTSEGALEYGRVTQRFVEWSAGDALRARAGTFTAILGRGLVYRAFELPGVVLEDPGLRTQHAFSRDTDGLLVAARRGAWTATALAGSPSDADAPRNLSDERGVVAGGEVAGRVVEGARAGAAYLRLAPGAGARGSEVVSTHVDIDPVRLAGGATGLWTVYAEYAGRDLHAGEWLTRSRAASHALYAATVLASGALTASLEVKDYRGFRLGVNDPPSLVRQHTAALLNRATHVLDANDETGHQLDAAYTLGGWGNVTANWSRGDGHVSAGQGRLRPVRYDERFVELALHPRGALSASAFADRHIEDLLAERRTTFGATAAAERGDNAVALDLEHARGRRSFAAAPFTDWYASFGVSRADRASLSLVLERSDDPEFTDRADTAPIETAARTVLAGLASATLTEGEELRVFAGERRGGLACTAGSCYLVPAFRGIEVTLVSRF